MLQDRGAELAKQSAQEREVLDALAKRRAEIEKASRAFKRQNEEIIDSINLEKSYVGKTEEFIEIERAREEVYKRSADQIQSLRDAKSMLTKDEQALSAVYDQQIKKITETLRVDVERVATAIEGLQGLRLVEKARLQDIENVTKAIEDQISRQEQLGGILRGINDQRVDLSFEGSLKGLTPLQKEIAKIQESARKAAMEAGRSLSAAFDNEDGLTPERAQELAEGLDAIAQGYRGIAQAQIETVVGFDPLKDAFEDFKNNAMDTGKQMADSFGNFTSGMEDAFVQFAQTGKLSFKSLANSIIADLIRIAVRRAIVAAIGGPLGSLFGMANGGSAMAGTPYMVGERGPELFVPSSAGKIVPNNVLSGSAAGQGAVNGGGQTVVNYNIQAVDASSFRSLVAKDPSFIYAVTEQGRRSQPTRTR
jgi:lambda family phage tail tape measure protein